MLKNPYIYQAQLVKVVDGDTIDVDVDLGFQIRQKIRLRLAGIDTPEVRGAEREAGLKSKDFVQKQLEAAGSIFVETRKTGKYGRYIAEVFYAPANNQPERSLNQELLELGLAEVYS